MSLFELTQNFLAVKEMLLDEEIDFEMVQNTLDCIDCMFEEKADNYAKLISYINGDIFLAENEIKRLTRRKEVMQKKIERLKENLKNSMEAIGKTKFSTAFYTFSIQKSGGLQPLKIDVDSKEIPEQYLIPQPPKLDTAAIREALKTQNLYWAHLEERKQTLRIK